MKSNLTGFSKLWRLREVKLWSNNDRKVIFVYLNHLSPPVEKERSIIVMNKDVKPLIVYPHYRTRFTPLRHPTQKLEPLTICAPYHSVKPMPPSQILDRDTTLHRHCFPFCIYGFWVAKGVFGLTVFCFYFHWK